MTPSVPGAVLGLVVGCGLLLVLSSLTEPRDRRSRASTRPLARLAHEAGPPNASGAAVVAVSGLAAMAAGVLAMLVTALPTAALLAGLAASAIPILALRRRAARRRRTQAEAWPDAVDHLVSAVRAGMSLPEAAADLGRVGPPPLRRSFASFAGEYRATGSFAGALDLLRDDLADPVADRVVAALRLAREFGGADLGVVLRTLSSMLRQDAQLRGEIASRQSWTVAAARMAVVAPWLTLALLCTRPEAARAYASAAGATVLVIVSALTVAAYLLMMRIGRLPVDERMSP